jgi:hypothetical protein
MIWNDLVLDILPHVPGCPEPMIEDVLRRIAIKFCRQTHAWEEQLEDVYLVEGVQRYSLVLPEETELLSISHLKHKNGSARSDVACWPDINVFGLISFQECINFKAGPLEVKAVLIPTKDSTGLPDRIGEHYREALIGGTLANLLAIPGRDWSAPQLVALHQEEFKEGLAEAKARSVRGNTNRPMRVAPRPLL